MGPRGITSQPAAPGPRTRRRLTSRRRGQGVMTSQCLGAARATRPCRPPRLPPPPLRLRWRAGGRPARRRRPRPPPPLGLLADPLRQCTISDILYMKRVSVRSFGHPPHSTHVHTRLPGAQPRLSAHVRARYGESRPASCAWSVGVGLSARAPRGRVRACTYMCAHVRRQTCARVVR